MAKLNSILDNDFYKFTMQFAVSKMFPRAQARYQFINRGQHQFPEGFDDRLRTAINELAKLKLTKAEKEFLRIKCPYMDPTYLDFLAGYRYDPDEVQVQQSGGELSVSIEGYWYRAILWEVPIMSLICELFYENSEQPRISNDAVREVVKEKMAKYDSLDITVADFGTRRRHSYEVHDQVIRTLKHQPSKTFIGTSNVHFAMKYETTPIGTHAHEWFMFHAAKYGYKMANLLGLEHWSDVYRGDLGIALSDTYTTEVFFKQFDKKLSKLFDGVRHDSGDPVTFAAMTIAHYQQQGIDPLSKTIVFSDSLHYDKVENIVHFCKGKIGYSFGIGTDFTNDVGLPRMNIVLKMVEAKPEDGEWTDVIKLSDERGKHTGNPSEIAIAKQILKIED